MAPSVAQSIHNQNYEPLQYIHTNNDMAVMAAASSKRSATTPLSVTNVRLKEGSKAAELNKQHQTATGILNAPVVRFSWDWSE